MDDIQEEEVVVEVEAESGVLRDTVTPASLADQSLLAAQQLGVILLSLLHIADILLSSTPILLN
jgi:hypothetical protein